MWDLLTSVALQVALALILDRAFGEPSHHHPLVLFGKLANHLERWFHPGEAAMPSAQKKQGVIALVCAVAFPVIIALLLSKLPLVGWWVGVILLWLAIGGNSLAHHARQVSTALHYQNLPAARDKTQMIVSRNCATLDENGVVKATTESVLENGSDAIFGAIFWFVIAGAPGVVLYRLANTLDAMWGYRNDRFIWFGWAAARFDDLINYIPARLTAYTYAIQGEWKTARQCWQRQAPQWDSPNAGVVMAAGAGALEIQLGGPAVYHGEVHQRPELGCGKTAQAEDIERAIALIEKGPWIWVSSLFVLTLMFS
ncbi:adenosylcobinamide-phosphate synthase CbiB [Pelagibaculum spongiae]|uniref:Cobalamin biosynthesis protein CobD n=1 Tax=Pelagibaculum spongiae TaxID=2080658 RepID=A0A2V1GZ24_9GAMM|nr:adenosylcobinamide-phosphate synthase CbiB [Pelagibaculum spongiae]PVZ67762.1 cobalamin biosynthesis protein [Pelagibaculum spongiae]